ncbi:hypothetical protein GCM10011348_42120 [Marinobacterium nitratireducens]|uniref:Uncharacterized protein n=1 Tax=Marinobacterium nitratireducens TaxID=518897 RepID=A0A918DY39_9GAMM|nr:hypothetical protein GCM10011348_42120 [Marinobacterium nitratireducens]
MLLIALRSFEPALYLAQLGIAVEHVVEHTTVDRRDFLGHVGDGLIAGQREIAGVGLQFAEYQLEQARFADAIGADNTDLPTLMKGQAGLVQQALNAAM